MTALALILVGGTFFSLYRAQGSGPEVPKANALYFLAYTNELRDDHMYLAEARASLSGAIAERDRDVRLYEMDARLYNHNALPAIDFRGARLKKLVSIAKVEEIEASLRSMEARMAAFELLKKRSVGTPAGLPEIYQGFLVQWQLQCVHYEATVRLSIAQHEYAAFEYDIAVRLHKKSHDSQANVITKYAEVVRADGKRKSAELYLKNCKEMPTWEQVRELNFP